MSERRRDLWSAEDGVSAIEFAFVASFLAVLLLGMLDFGIGYWQQQQVGNAARAGAEYAIRSGFDSSAIENAVTHATTLSGVSASPAPSESCGCPSATQGVVPATCGSTCSSGAAAGTYVTSNAQVSYKTIVPWPVISNPVILSSSATVRIN